MKAAVEKLDFSVIVFVCLFGACEKPDYCVSTKAELTTADGLRSRQRFSPIIVLSENVIEFN